MKEFATWALDTAVARGATYAEVRVLDTRQRYLSTKNGQTSQVRESQSLGLGIRVIAEGGWGFASTDTLTHADVDRAAALAVEIARASALTKKARRPPGSGKKVLGPLGGALPDRSVFHSRVFLLWNSCSRSTRNCAGCRE